LGLDIGDAHVIRNAGGRASEDAIRSLIISSILLGTREFVVIHHTDCGMLTFTSQELQERLTEETGADASGMEFLTFADLEESVVEDVHRIRESPFISDDIPVSGFVYDVRTGRLREDALTGLFLPSPRKVDRATFPHPGARRRPLLRTPKDGATPRPSRESVMPRTSTCGLSPGSRQRRTGRRQRCCLRSWLRRRCPRRRRLPSQDRSR
jgi:carbonic anhydrase